ncbi:MAG TPA: glycosyltransferase family 2 protein [Thermoanaerobaculales bacterium]|nr:glycosyltransferase family 2 protein [Thermoanaerobaculales bacterium]HQL30533.1 glycosyltransferase family 2 protein [Thermoanaerobaculales bacterium]
MNPAPPVTIPVSAVLITRDAERLLDRVLAPLAVCSEILILDSGSRDRTREIAAAHGAAWHEHPFEGYGPQKRRAVALAAHDWVLSVDADEVLDERAAAALAGVEWSAADPRTCWQLRRRPFIGSREIRHGDWAPDWVVRVFNRRHHGLSANPVHESVRPTGPVRRLDGSLLHFTATDLAGVFRPDYYRLKAAVYRERGRRARAPMLAVRAAAAFLRSYLLRAGLLDGSAGVVVAVAAAANAVTGLALAAEAPRADRSRAGEVLPPRR